MKEVAWHSQDWPTGNFKVDPKIYDSCGSYELLVNNEAHKMNEN